ncbi:MAG: hypothetical protein EON58_17625 [Alphaproteobacteria bacterium]|nr:MAG: hypothetical protein EON58_17625 [Alphaproteobacteria bacterium]
MSSNVAIQALEASLSLESSTPNLGQGDRETYLQEQRLALRACVIEPVAVTARAGTWAQQHCGMSANPYRMIAVAYFKSQVGQCLLYNPDTGLFSLAYGHLDSPDGVDLIGHSSTDALGEWLG